jgi:hypothetical protein
MSNSDPKRRHVPRRLVHVPGSAGLGRIRRQTDITPCWTSGRNKCRTPPNVKNRTSKKCRTRQWQCAWICRTRPCDNRRGDCLWQPRSGQRSGRSIDCPRAARDSPCAGPCMLARAAEKSSMVRGWSGPKKSCRPHETLCRCANNVFRLTLGNKLGRPLNGNLLHYRNRAARGGIFDAGGRKKYSNLFLLDKHDRQQARPGQKARSRNCTRPTARNISKSLQYYVSEIRCRPLVMSVDLHQSS